MLTAAEHIRGEIHASRILEVLLGLPGAEGAAVGQPAETAPACAPELATLASRPQNQGRCRGWQVASVRVRTLTLALTLALTLTLTLTLTLIGLCRCSPQDNPWAQGSRGSSPPS